MDFDNDRPIYLQIVEQMKMDIISGRYAKGDKVPSVRELAARYRVNPNTMQRAFAELESMHLVYTERTNGRFVTADEKIIAGYKDEIVESKAKEFLDFMKDLGISDEELIQLLQKVRKGDEL